MAFNKPNQRRIFLSANRKDYFKIFTFTQEKDGDIYCHWPNFTQTKWANVYFENNLAKFTLHDTPEDSLKLSLHRSGVVKFKNNNNETDTLRIYGNHLLNKEKDIAGLRHLFTAFISEPNDLSINSPYGNRKGDYPIFTNKFTPLVLIFFAVPQMKNPLKIKLGLSFDASCMPDQEVIGNIGCDVFSLAYHDIVWVAYRTSDIFKWPKNNIIFYHNGFLTPLFLGQKTVSNSNKVIMKFILQEPKFEINGSNLKIMIDFPNPDSIHYSEENNKTDKWFYAIIISVLFIISLLVFLLFKKV